MHRWKAGTTRTAAIALVLLGTLSGAFFLGERQGRAAAPEPGPARATLAAGLEPWAWLALAILLAGHWLLVRNSARKPMAEAPGESRRRPEADLVDAMPSLLIGLDGQGRISQWNRQAADRTGVNALAALGRPFQELLPEFAPWIGERRAEAIRTGRPATLEQRLVVREGRRNVYDIMVFPLPVPGGPGVGVRIEDVTERTRIQEQLVQTDKLMSIGGLAAGMAHEINNPLGVISQAAQNIERRLSPDLPSNRAAAASAGLDGASLKGYFEQRKIPEFMASIHEAVDRATTTVGTMLQFSRRTDGGKTQASLTLVVQQALELAASGSGPKGPFRFRNIEILREFDPDLPLVTMNPIEVEQAVLNLLMNAAQAMADNPPGRAPRLGIRLSREPCHLVLAIQDNGPGMDPSVSRRIFEPFYTTREPGIGKGLGLSVAYMIIVQNHQGSLQVDSAPGQGACFTLRLPTDRLHTS